MNMMKKLMALLLVCVMVLSTSVVVFAAGSVTAAPDGLEIRFKDDFENEEDAQAAAAIKADPAAVLKSLGLDPEKYTLLLVKDAYLFDTVNDKALTDDESSVTTTLDGVDVKASDKVLVLHFSNGAWRQETAVAGNGSVTITVTKGCSPIAVFVEKADTTGTANGAGAGKAPKTGEGSFASVMLAVMAMAAAGIFVSVRKKTVK